MSTLKIQISDLSFDYGKNRALDRVSMEIKKGGYFAFVGPNGGGKTTLFQILSTAFEIQEGDVSVFGTSLRSHPGEIRKNMGVLFQSPSLDRRLTVFENLEIHAVLYGLSRKGRREKIQTSLEKLGVLDQMHAIVDELSGGQKRRVEIAKVLLHDPDLLLMDEPSTGLDPKIRRELLELLQSLCRDFHKTILVTTHILEEADVADEIAILDQGRIVAQGKPRDLKSSIEGDVITLECDRPEQVLERMIQELGIQGRRVNGSLQIEATQGMELMARIMHDFKDDVSAISFRRPTLEDVFLRFTGKSFHRGSEVEDRL